MYYVQEHVKNSVPRILATKVSPPAFGTPRSPDRQRPPLKDKNICQAQSKVAETSMKAQHSRCFARNLCRLLSICGSCAVLCCVFS